MCARIFYLLRPWVPRDLPNQEKPGNENEDELDKTVPLQLTCDTTWYTLSCEMKR